jgi:hypothetical protein
LKKQEIAPVPVKFDQGATLDMASLFASRTQKTNVVKQPEISDKEKFEKNLEQGHKKTIGLLKEESSYKHA